MDIRIIVTGGTFDKRYDELTGSLTLDQTHLPEILEKVRCTAPLKLEVNQLADSLDISDVCRQSILESCKTCPEKHIVITHGTDTMCRTAEVIGAADLPKTIVLTGAMIPYAFGDSDAMFNLGMALGAVQTLPTGVHIAMNGRIFPWDNVRKNHDRGIFEERETGR
ncbi:MAG: asparaginase [Phycisphaerae bacterium]|nr:asparaginase [Phycisphaerae bacterium]